MHNYHLPQSRTERPTGESDALIPAESSARYIENLRLTPEGTLRAVQPPPELAPQWRLDNTGFVKNYSGLLLNADYTRDSSFRYNGVFHARLGEFGARDVTLWHFRGTVWAYQGWNSPHNYQWEPVYGNLATTDTSYGYAFPEDSSLTQFLTQFVRLPSGILIIPQGARAAVYDGYRMLYLGYDSAPGAPEPLSPKPISFYDSGSVFSDASRVYEPNEGGFNFNGRSMPWSFGTCRLGTIDVMGATGNFYNGGGSSGKKHTNPNGGTLKEGMIRAKVQWVNAHGDLSPASPPSTAWTCQKEDNVSKDRKKDDDEMASVLRLQAWWSGIVPGPEGTIGRVFSKTRDLINSGDPVFYEVPANSCAGTHEFATLPDNVSESYPDNVPESWLVAPTTDVDAMPLFRVAAMYANRLWIGNATGDPGVVRASRPGQWGTLPKDKHIYYPDPSGAEVTGLFATERGLLVFTETTTALCQINDEGTGFRWETLSRSVGCVSPDSIALLPGGAAVWLGREGFHAYQGGEVSLISRGGVEDSVRRINPARRHRACAVVDPDVGEYRCWVPLDRSDFNDHCFVFDGTSWRERNDMVVDCAAVTDDHRQYVLAAGAYPRADSSNSFDSLFVLDKAGAWTREYSYSTPTVTGIAQPLQATWKLRSAWLRANRAHRRGSPLRIRLWFRETANARVRMRVYRDWRESPAVMDVAADDDKAPDTYPTDDPPAFFDTTKLGSSVTSRSTRTARGSRPQEAAAFRKRRPFWSKMDIAVPSCEVFAFELEGQGDFEFIGFQYLENSQSHHGGNNTPGGKR